LVNTIDQIQLQRKSSDVSLDSHQFEAFVGNLKRKEGRIRWLRLGLIGSTCAILILLSITLGTSILAFSSHINDQNELVSLDGAPVRIARLESFSTLTDLPGQSLQFLAEMRGVYINVGGEMHHYAVVGFKWSNVSYMVVEASRGRDIVIAGGRAYLRESAAPPSRFEAPRASRAKIFHVTTPASEPECGRRLSTTGTPTLPHPHSWAEIVNRYHDETSRSTGDRNWRSLSASPGESASDMYEWFGALISSDVAAAEHAKALASGSLHAEYCSYDTRGLECAAYETSRDPLPPALSESGFNKFLLIGGGETWLLYLDHSDWSRGSAVAPVDRKVRSKMVSGVGLDDGDARSASGAVIRVTESDGAGVVTYQMLHPAVLPERYNLTASGDWLGTAERVLESPDFESLKAECRQSATTRAVLEDVKQASPSSVAFDCEDGSYTWAVNGWRVQASADGVVKAFIFGSISDDGSGQGGNNSTSSLRYRVLSHSDGGDARTNYRLSLAFEHGYIFKSCSASGEGKRSLRASARVRNLGSTLPGTNWCGPGQCGSDSANCKHNYCLDTFEGDWACRRHDACEKWDRDFLGLTVMACSCDKALFEKRGSGNALATSLIAGAYAGHGVRPCISHESQCTAWGWVQAGRRRRWGWSYWGQTGKKPCDNWNYINKYDDPKIQDFGYSPQINGYDIQSTVSWPGCIDNTADR